MTNKIKKEEKAIIDCIKDYLKDCPYLDSLSQINVDYLNTDSKDFEYWSLEPLEVPIVLKENVLKTKSERQCQFILATRSFFNPIEDAQNIKNLRLFENIAEWFYENTINKKLPTLNENETSTKIEALSSGFLYGTDKNKTLARYQIHCKLTYEKRRESIWNY